MFKARGLGSTIFQLRIFPYFERGLQFGKMWITREMRQKHGTGARRALWKDCDFQIWLSGRKRTNVRRDAHRPEMQYEKRLESTEDSGDYVGAARFSTRFSAFWKGQL